MKAVILAAGEGKRMRPVSDIVPKEMIPILGKPFLYYVITKIADAGIKDIVIVTTTKKMPLVQELDRYGDLSVNLTYVIQKEPLGPAHALLQAKSLLDSDYFLVYYGDNIAEGNVPRELVSELSRNRNADSIVALRAVSDTSRYGIARFAGKRIVEIVEKPKIGSEPSKLAAMGIYILRTQKFFESLEGMVFEYGKEQFPPQYIIRTGGDVVGWRFDGEWVDMGKPEDMLRVSLMLAAGQIRCIVFIKDQNSCALPSQGSIAGTPTSWRERFHANLIRIAESNEKRNMLFVTREDGSESRIRVELSPNGNFSGVASRKEIYDARTFDQLYSLVSNSYPHKEVLVVGGDYLEDLLPAARLGMHVLLANEPEDLTPLERLP